MVEISTFSIDVTFPSDGAIPPPIITALVGDEACCDLFLGFVKSPKSVVFPEVAIVRD